MSEAVGIAVMGANEVERDTDTAVGSLIGQLLGLLRQFANWLSQFVYKLYEFASKDPWAFATGVINLFILFS